MRARGAISSVLAVLLLAISCVASACTARCDLGALGKPVVAAAGSTHDHDSGEPHIAAMRHCAMPALERGSRAALALMEAGSACSHRRCGVHAALLTSREEPATQSVQVHMSAASLVGPTLVLQTQRLVLDTSALQRRLRTSLPSQLRI